METMQSLTIMSQTYKLVRTDGVVYIMTIHPDFDVTLSYKGTPTDHVAILHRGDLVAMIPITNATMQSGENNLWYTMTMIGFAK